MTWPWPGATRSRAAAKASNSPRQQQQQQREHGAAAAAPYAHHHFQHRGLLSSGGAPCGHIRRNRFLLGLLLLGAFLLANMLLLVPHLHVHGPTTDSLRPAAAQPPAAAAVDSSSSSRQRGARSLTAPKNDLWHDFDANGDGVLGPTEFDVLAQEACRADRSSLGPLSWLVRFMRLGLGLAPQYVPAGPYPCSLWGELADATRQVAAALSISIRSSGVGSSRSKGRGSKGLRDEQRADNAAGAAAVDPDSPEGRAAARRTSLLARCSPLTPELAAAAASHGTLLLVAADWGMFELFGVNWLSHVQRSGVDNYLLAALDQKTADFLTRNKLGHCISWNPDLPGGGEGVLPAYTPPAASAGSSQHARLSWASLAVAQVLLGWEYDVLLSHLDTVWLTDPLPYLHKHVPAAADVVLSSEAPAAAAVMGSRSAELLPYPDPRGALGTGVAYVRGTAQGQAAVGAWLDTHEAQLAKAGAAAAAAAAAGDSRVSSSSSRLSLPDDVVRAWLRSGSSSSRQQEAVVQGPHPAEPKSLLLVGPRPGLWGQLFGARHRLAHSAGVGVFTPVAVANSYSWFVQGVGWRAAAVVARSSSSAASGRKLPLAVHVGAGHSSREGRLHQLRDAQWYADGPKYYSDPKLLSFELAPYSSPEVTAGLANAPDFSQGELLALHMASLAHQLQQFYAGAAVAAMLGRVLVLPTFQCYCYRDPGSGPGGPGELSWGSSSSSSSSGGAAAAEWACRAPGDDNSVLPFNCTLDQVMDPSALYAAKPAFAGRPLLFREAPFLANPRSPSWIRHAATTVTSGVPAGCRPEGSAGAAGGGGVGGSLPCAQVLTGKPPPGINQQVVVPPGLTDAVLTEVLAPVSAAKWLHFTDVAAVFGGFAARAHRAEYEAWLDRVVLPWCCKPAGDDGGSIASRSSRRTEEGGTDGLGALGPVVPVDFTAAAGGDSGLPLAGIVELPTAVPGWVMVDLKARPAAAAGGAQ